MTYFPFRYFNSWLEPSSSAEKSLNLGTKKVGNGETRHHWHFSDLIIQPIHCNVCHSLLLTTKGIIFKRLENYSLVLNTSHGTLNQDTLNFPQNPFIATWSLSKKFAMSTISTWSLTCPCYFKAKMTSLSHQ